MKKSCPGFTLVELLVTISIIGILFGLGVAQYNKFNRRQILDQAAQELKSNLRLAQNKAAAGDKGDCSGAFEGYEFNFDPDSYSFYPHCETDGTVTSKTLPTGVSLSSSPSTLILFRPVGLGIDVGSATPPVTITLTGSGQTQTIVVGASGDIK